MVGPGRRTALGVDRPSIAATLRGVIAQRLMRRVCPECAVPIGPGPFTDSESELAGRFGTWPAVRSVGVLGDDHRRPPGARATTR